MAEKEAKTSLLELPEDILLQIMSLLPTTPDVIAVDISSKSLISVLRSFQRTSMDFCHPELRPNTIEGFLTFMIASITALERSNTCPERFRLQAPLMRMGMDSRIEKAIGFAVRNSAKELDIHASIPCVIDRGSYYDKYHSLPVRVIITYPSNSITTLNFKGLRLDNHLNQLILGCPHIKTVVCTTCIVPTNTRLSSNTLKKIHISHCLPTLSSNTLKEIYFTHYSLSYYSLSHHFPYFTLSIEVDSPNLQDFVVDGTRKYRTFIPIKFPTKCNFLKVLSLEKASISDQWVKACIAELVHLETLTLKHCSNFNNFKVSNHHKLRMIELISCEISQSIEIGVLQLESFTAHSGPYNFREFEIDMNGCTHLKHLGLRGYPLTQEFLEREISEMTSLESVIFQSCNHFPITKIFQPSVTSLELFNRNYEVKEIHVNAPRLVSFKYTGNFIPLHVSCSKPLLEATLANCYDRYHRFKLKAWFEFSGQCQTARLVIESYKDFTLPRKFSKHFVAPLNGLKRLTLEIGECSWSRISRHLVESLLWLYPDLEALSIDYISIKKGNRRYVMNVPCHDPKLLATFLKKNTDDDL